VLVTCAGSNTASRPVIESMARCWKMPWWGCRCWVTVPEARRQAE